MFTDTLWHYTHTSPHPWQHMPSHTPPPDTCPSWCCCPPMAGWCVPVRCLCRATLTCPTWLCPPGQLTRATLCASTGEESAERGAAA
jgi:hypothetical protein